MTETPPDHEARRVLQHRVDQLEREKASLIAQLDQEQAEHKNCHLEWQDERESLHDTIQAAYENLGAGYPYVTVSVKSVSDPDGVPWVDVRVVHRQDMSDTAVGQLLELGLRSAREQAAEVAGQ